MHRLNSRETAKQLALTKHLEFGHSVFDGKFYVGTVEELTAIAVILDKESPRNLKMFLDNQNSHLC